MRKRRTQRTDAVVAYPGDSKRDLPVSVELVEGMAVRTSVWELEPNERAAIATGKANVAVSIWGPMHPPISVAITRDRVLPITPGERIPTGLTLWLELDRTLVLDLLTTLAPIAEDLRDVRASHDAGLLGGEQMARLERLAELHDRVLEYLPHLTPIADEEEDQAA
jgi:hypothetical protein